jgi:hypothetical protein
MPRLKKRKKDKRKHKDNGECVTITDPLLVKVRHLVARASVRLTSDMGRSSILNETVNHLVQEYGCSALSAVTALQIAIAEGILGGSIENDAEEIAETDADEPDPGDDDPFD